MTIYVAGGESEIFASLVASVSTTTSTYDALYARCAMDLGFSGSALLNVGASLVDTWVHFEIGRDSMASGLTWLTLRNASNVGLVRATTTDATSAVAFQYWNGATWTTFATGALGLGTALTQIDVHCFVDNTTGVYEAFINGVSAGSFTGDTDLIASATVTNVLFGPLGNAGAHDTFLSQFIIADEDTRSMKVATLAPASDGDSTTWTGTYADVDEVGIATDTDFISSATANEVELFNLADLSAVAQALDVVAFVQTSRGRKGLTGPQNIQYSLKTHSTEYESADISGVTTTFSNFPNKVWDVNPNTGVAWTIAEIQAVQAGFKSIT